MKQQWLLPFLGGLVLPLALAAFFPGKPPVREAPQESTGAGEVLTGDSPQELTVQNPKGEAERMTLEDYLTGVVLAEMPADFEDEALKAQAVVARTYTRKRMEGGKHGAAAVCMDSGCCQGWRSVQAYLEAGGTEGAVDKVRKAVADTEGLVLCYGGQLIDATYFSCSGGTTEAAVAVWGRDVPYLQSVESPGEEAAPRYSDSVRLSAKELADKLGLESGGDPADWFGSVRYTDGGGVETMVIRGRSFTGTQLRSKLGLRSTAFTVSVSRDAITIETRGFGHRVGMSQYGAQAMAQAGKDFSEILAHYYTGAELVSE